MSSYRIKIVLIIAIVFLSTNLFSQNGYKNFKWGESLEKINSLVNDLESFPPESHSLFIAFTFQNSKLYGESIPDPLFELKGEVLAFDSRSQNMAFYFLDSALFCVEITFKQETIYKELEAKYGKVKSKFLDLGYGDFRETKAWFNNKGRIVTYWKLSSSPLGEETISYTDSRLYFKIADTLKKERASETKTNRKKID